MDFIKKLQWVYNFLTIGMRKSLIFLFMLFLCMPLVVCSYTSRNAQILHTQLDDNTEDGKFFIIDSVEELTEYIETESESRMLKYVENCNEKFFKNNSLVFVLISEWLGSVSHKLKDVKINGDVIDVTVKRKVPEIVTCDMAEWTVMFDITKEEASSIKDVNLILK